MSIYTHADGASSHPEEVLDFMASRLVATSGVFDVAGGELLVSEEDTPAMSVKVASGYAYLKKSDGTKAYPVFINVDDSVDISANASGNTRIDAIVLYYNSGATPSADSTGVATLVAIQGTPAGSPVAPDDSAIQVAIGASNPFIRLADVEVASGAVSILDADITDQRVAMTYSDLVVATLEKATGAEVTTGTDDAKYITPKALSDANIKSTGRLVWSTRQALSSNFVHSSSAGEEEVTGLRISLPVLTGTYVVEITFSGYLQVPLANNQLKIRVGTSTSYLTNTEETNLYIGTAKALETAYLQVLKSINLATQTYVVFGASCDSSPASYAIISSGNRSSVIVKVFTP